MKFDQIDLFDIDLGHRKVPRSSRLAQRRRGSATVLSCQEEDLAKQLEGTGRYRILRKLVPRQIVPRSQSAFEHLGVIVDTETTGLHHSVNEVIEIGAVAFTYADNGRFGDVVGVFSGLQQPSDPIPAEITRLTGITDQMVLGQSINFDELNAFIEPADLVIAHNARFDRPFCEKLSSCFVPKAWACSVTEIPWPENGFEGSKLGYLIGQSGYFHEGHRAVDDCHALLEVLNHPLEDGATTPFTQLLDSYRKSRIRIYAENSPFDMKDHLKGRSYRWSDGSDGRPRSWWIEIPEDAYEDELQHLREEVYRWDEAEPLTQRLTAQDRFKAS